MTKIVAIKTEKFAGAFDFEPNSHGQQSGASSAA